MFSASIKDNNLLTENHAACDIKNDIANAANQAGQKVRSLYAAANHNFSQAADHVTAEIRNRPVRSTAIALGIGLLFGSLFRR